SKLMAFKTRKILYNLHLYLGLAIGALVAFVGLTGSALILKPEAEILFNPELYRVQPQAGRAPFEQIATAAQAAYQWGDPSFTIIHFPMEETGVYRVLMKEGFKEDSGPWFRVTLDPYTGKTLGGWIPDQSPAGFLLSLHSNLLIGEGEHGSGAKIVAMLGVATLIFGITGIILWWPGLMRLASGFKINWRSSTQKLNLDIHQVLGVLALVPLMLLAVTGVTLVFPGYVRPAVKSIMEVEPPPAAPSSDIKADLARLSLDEVLKSADRAFPNARVTSVMIPGGDKGSFTIRKRFPNDPHQYYSNGKALVWIDQYSGEILKTHDARTMSVGSRMVHDWLFPTHTGEVAGTAGRIIAFLAGIAPAILFITGFTVWWIRRQRRNQAGSMKPDAAVTDSEVRGVPV
ncbi:MAG: PepSY-associated TM helix domain-containing protein, partial [Acidobacteriota bacterium]